MDSFIEKIARFSITALVAVLLFVISYAIGSAIFIYNIDTTYSQYDLLGEGKFTKEVDCIGNAIYSVGGIIINNHTYTYSLCTKNNAIDILRGGDCEYKLYKGWHWGIGDFYYITAK
jgi:hypothetical protein